MNDRIAELRKALGMTLESFGRELGVGKTAIQKMESGSVVVTPQNAKLICLTTWPGGRKVSSHWLETGEGDMFLKPSESERISAYVNSIFDKDSTVFQRRVLSAMDMLPTKKWDDIEQMICELAGKDS